MKKFISLFLVFSILALSIPLTAKERKGADLIIQKKEGQQVRGEPIDVFADYNLQRFSLSIGEVILEFPCPSDVEEPEGLAFCQGYLWLASQTQGIYQLDPSDGLVVSWIPMPMGCIEIHGLAHDGDYLWAAAYDNNLYQIDPSDGSVISLIPAPGGGHIEGLGWGNNYLWLSRDDRNIYKLDPSTGVAVDFITTGSLDPEGLTYGGGFLWEGGFDNNISKIDPQTGSIISSFSGPGYDVCGLAWDGTYLWADSQIDKMIYKINVLTPAEVWVDDDYCDGCHNGGHVWGYDAFDKIQDGIDALTSGGTVHVADGTYYENINFNGKAIVVMSESGPYRTTINGTGIGDVVIGATGSTIQGFTITGSGNTWYDCGVQAYLATMTIRGNIITGNWLGINTSNGQTPIIVNNIIHNNSHYGIVASHYSSPIIINNTIVFNDMDGICSQSGTGLVENNIIFSNGRYGIYCTLPGSSPEISYNDVYGNQMGNYYNCSSGVGAISANPLFVDAVNGNYHLSNSSPCIDAGIMTPNVPDSDIEGNPRPNPPSSSPDMGAYEHPALFSPFISLSSSVINFGANTSGDKTSDQQFLIVNSGDGVLEWSISDNAPWLSCTPASGTEDAAITVSLNPVGLSVGTYNATITVSSFNAINSPQFIQVNLTVYREGRDSKPFGHFDTPIDNSMVMGSIAVTGWTLDDIEVTRVAIKRDPVTGDPPGAIGSDGLVYIGDGVFVKGSRPDVKALYPGYPNNYRAGWGYMMLTYGLPNRGNGTFMLHAFAYDSSGNKASLGKKTIISNNSSNVKPFGAIDTPAQGGIASGSDYVNWGWALTPPPKEIPRDGSTIWVFIDSVPVGHPDYDKPRQLIADKFPDHLNSDGPVGLYYIDTTQYENGVHTIAWSATDNVGKTDGIGSRFFEIQNVGGVASLQLASRSEKYREDLSGRLGIRIDGEREIEIEELGRIELKLKREGGGKCIGWGENRFEKLPIGSTLDQEEGVFYWMPGPGFLGKHILHFAVTDGEFLSKPIRIIVNIVPKKFHR